MYEVSIRIHHYALGPPESKHAAKRGRRRRLPPFLVARGGGAAVRSRLQKRILFLVDKLQITIATVIRFFGRNGQKPPGVFPDLRKQ